VDETTPSLAGAAQAAGLEVKHVPLLALDAQAWRPPPEPQGATVRMLRADDPALPAAQAAVELAFGSEDAGPAERDAAVAGVGDLGFLRDRLHRGLTAMAVAEDDADGGVLAAGSHQPVGAVSEVVGVGTLPSARRRGIGLALTGRLVEDAISRGVGLVFLSAADEGVARLYERVGFRRVGTACFAGPPA
jgi:ribosomal protein S18 acetylase RimI-like enzyme